LYSLNRPRSELSRINSCDLALRRWLVSSIIHINDVITKAMNNKIIVDHSEIRPIVLKLWFMQAIFWTLLTVFSFFSLTLWYASPDISHIVYDLLQSLIGLALTIPMHWIYRSMLKQKGSVVLLVWSLAVVLIFSFIWSILRISTFILVTEEGHQLWGDFGGWYFSGFFVFLCWTAIYYSLYYYSVATAEKYRRIKQVERSRGERVKRLSAEKSAAEAKMQMLRYQLNPHFLFNTLNAVNSLIASNEPAQARETIEKLSMFLRFALKEEKTGWVSLSSEIEALELYLGIELIRFADRLTIEFDIDDAALNLEVPSLLLQPMAENSIKHAVNVCEDVCLIRVSASVTDDYLTLMVSDNGPGIASLNDGTFTREDFEFTGLGVRNIIERVDNVYGEKASVTLENKKDVGLSVFVRLPIRNNL
jgi:two-component system, LytTR family, sensor kinase